MPIYGMIFLQTILRHFFLLFPAKPMQTTRQTCRALRSGAFFYALLLILVLLSALPQTAPARTLTFTDDAGRSHTLPHPVARVYATSPTSIVPMYMLAPELLAGWCTPISGPEQRFIPEKYLHLPILGGRYGLKGTMNPEVVLKAKPDLIVTASAREPEKAVADAERLQRQLRIPVLVLDGRLESIPKMFRTLGAALNRQERAEKLALYAQRLLDETKERVADIPPERRLRVYYAEGPRALHTDPRGSWHTQVLDFVQAINVAEGGDRSEYGRTPVSLEQVLVWKPDLILINDDAGTQGDVMGLVRQSPAWGKVKAVRENRVYALPHGPFNWFDRPPSANRLGGILWLRHLLYPERFPGDFDAAVREFFALFYQRDLSEEDLDYLHLRAR